ncbi:hypothetical protein [Flavobacterium sp. I3-2]|uniref:hypothetical protein n=1 Tax=Flavobacterium sp. I3-2 TaxID=2748319 RepID=UPI0015A92EF0|nr:hypothetical protein [Flavobacterium sp. I3-2]
MNREFLNEAINLFDTPEKWSSFIELSNKKEEIRNFYLRNTEAALNRRFRELDVVESWDVSFSNNQYKWFLKEFGINSICVYFNPVDAIFRLLGDNNVFDLNRTNSELKTEYFSPILSFIERIDGVNDGWELITEKGNFNFDSPYDGNFTGDKLAWYAGNRTEEFVKQIAEKVNRIRRNPELSQLLRELNEKCKR